MTRKALVLLALLVLAPLPLMTRLCVAQTSYPMLLSVKPACAQVGTSSEHTITAQHSMYGAYQVLVTGNGVTGDIVTPMKKLKPGESPPKLTRLKVKFTVQPEARTGVRDVRLATPNGASTLGQLVIVRDPVVTETGKNNTPEQANSVELPASICGTIERNEDVDMFKFRAKAGEAFTFHVRSMRLQDRIHNLQRHVDPIIALKNSSGSTLAQVDNHFAADPLLHHRFEQDGEYYLEIRDVRYHGNRYWEYGIEVNDEPFITCVHPMGVRRGDTTKLQLVGYQLPQQNVVPLTASEELSPGVHELPLKLPGGGLSNPVAVVVGDKPQTVEADGDNDRPDAAQPVSVPGDISGRISQPSDIDCYAFEAKKGGRFTFEVLARRWNSALDSHLRILDAKTGKQLAVNDDMRANRRTFPDSQIENWMAPADGTYAVEVRDLHLRGGDDFVYCLRVRRALPTFELYLDTDKTQLTPETSGVIFARAVRKNGFQGEIELAVEGLPETVRASCGRILPGKSTDGCIVLTAADDAEMTVDNITVTGIATRELPDGTQQSVQVEAIPQQETYMPGGGRNHWHVDMHTVSIGAPGDIRSVKLSTDHVTLKPGESQRIDVTIERAPGFDKNVTLDVLYRHLRSTFADTLPPGVTIDSRNSKTLLTGKTSRGSITLKAASNAKPVQKQQVTVMANISLNFVMKATYASPPLFITVEKP